MYNAFIIRGMWILAVLSTCLAYMSGDFLPPRLTHRAPTRKRAPAAPCRTGTSQPLARPLAAPAWTLCSSGSTPSCSSSAQRASCRPPRVPLPCQPLRAAWRLARTAAAAGGATWSGLRASRGARRSLTADGASAAPVACASTCHHCGPPCPAGTTLRTASRAAAAPSSGACGQCTCRARAVRYRCFLASRVAGCASRAAAGATAA